MKRSRNTISNPVGKPSNQIARQLNIGSSTAAAPAANKYPADVPTPPSATSNQPRWAAGIISAISVKVIGNRPPAEAPIRKHIARFHPNAGIAPQIAVPMNIKADNRIVARRPKVSASRPQTIEPTVVPVSATKARMPAVSLLISYSRVMPGITKPRLAGFNTSTANATTNTMTSFQCSRLRGTLSATWKCNSWPPWRRARI